MGKSFAAHLHWTPSWRFHYAPSEAALGHKAVLLSSIHCCTVETRHASVPLLFLCSCSLPLLLNALCNILIKKFLQSLLPYAGCWLIMRSHCAWLNSTQLSSTQLDLVRWRIKAEEGTKGLSVPCDRLTIVNNNSSSKSSTWSTRQTAHTLFANATIYNVQLPSLCSSCPLSRQMQPICQAWEMTTQKGAITWPIAAQF